MVKHKLKRLLALALSILLLSSELSGLITAARAAEAKAAGDAVTGEQLDFRDQNNGRPNLFVDFLGDNNYYRPGKGTPALGTLVAPAGYDQSQSSNPTGPDNHWTQYKSSDIDSVTANETIFWVGIGIDRKEIFKLLEDNKGLTSFEGGFYYDKEVIEPYYDPADLPAGADPAAPTAQEVAAAYKATVARANINNAAYPANTQWGGNYEILRAEIDLQPATDLITQEEINNPSIDQILTGQYNDGYDRNWRMTYVSLELKDIADQNRRLKGVYDEDAMYQTVTDGSGTHKVLSTPAAAQGTGLEAGESAVESDYQYLLIVPFRLKSYGGEQRLHLRLLRNATHFSMGAGEYGASTYGETEDDVYAAWERVTTRNPDRDLKLLTNFTGDLYLFNAVPPKANDEEYTALLKIINGGSTENTARLEVDGDPAVWPVWADTDGDEIEHLYSGLGMKLKVHAQIGYTASVRVTYPAADGTTVTHLFTSDVPGTANPDGSFSFPDRQDSNHEFVIPVFGPPPRTITVTVTFQHVSGDEFRVFLSEIPQPGDAGYKTGNETTVTTNLDTNLDPTTDSVVINSFDPAVPHPNTSHTGITHADGPMGMATKDKGVRIHIETHADYEALVRTYNFLQQSYTIDPDVKIDPVGGSYSTDNNLQIVVGTDGNGQPVYGPNPDYGILLPMGGDVVFTMGGSDVDVEVIYRKAKRHKATLEVYHAMGARVLDANVAQMGYLAYDEENVSSMVYSGVVYEDDAQTPSDHRAVKNPVKEATRKLPWVSRSAATLSGSLGGDTGRVGKVWHPADLDTPLDPETGSGTVMGLLAAAPDLATFRTQLNGLDLSTTVMEDSGGAAILTGLRKNLYGDFFGDADADDLADILWELRLRIDADTATGGLKDTYHKSVPKSDTDPTVAYEYYDLTAAQVQDYLLSVFNSEAQDNKNLTGYREVRRAYLAAKQIYDELMAQTSYQADLKPIYAPNEPRPVEVSADGVRKYEDPMYEALYLHSYRLYIASYRKYVEAAKQYGSATAAEVTQLWQSEQLDLHQGNIQNTFTQAAVPIHTASVSAANVAAQTWKTPVIKPDGTPDADEDPANPANTIYTRDGRTVWVALEADSAYEVARVELYSQDEDGNTGALITSVVPTLAAGYQNVYAFTMPEEDCVVRVTYGLRTTRGLNITYKGADGKKSNVSVVEAYQVADPAGVTPNLAKRTNENDLTTDPYSPDPIQKVFVGSTVSIQVDLDEDYQVELMAVNADGSTRIPINTPAIPAGETQPREGLYTFIVPDLPGDMQLTITYKPTSQPINQAIINALTPTGTGIAGNTAFWRDNGLHHKLDAVPQHTHLTGEITVAPGYYIRSVTAYGASGNYPYTLTGNGYNGGYGTSQTGTSVPVNVFVDMPDETLIVDVEFAYGIPPAAPENTLTLTVKDDDNKGPAPNFANNWAKATVYDAVVPITDTTTPPAFTLGEVGHTHASLSQREYATAGQWVKVEFGAHTEMKDGKIDPAKSYYVSKVTVGPSNLGVSMVWEDDHTASFFMPAGSTGVTVEFSKYPDTGRLPDYVLTVSETYQDLNSTTTPLTQDDYNKNYVTHADSATIRRWNGNTAVSLHPYNIVSGKNNPERVPATDQEGATGVATAGEKVTMTFVVDEGPDENNVKWYVQSVVVISDGAAYRGTYKEVGSSGTQKTYTAEFRMPTGDAEFIVHYRRGPRPTTPDYGFTLSLTDDDNALLDDNSGLYDENNIVASFVDASGMNIGGHVDLEVGHNKSAMTDVRHIHAGDTVTLTTTLAPGYTLDYMLVNPSGLHLHPVWTGYTTAPDGVVTATATLTMPPEGIAVVARVVKGKPRQYTANLILHPPQKPDGTYYSMDDVGQGTFAGFTGGSLAGYYQSAVFSTYAEPGVTIPYDLFAFDGFYIDRVTVDPPLGVSGTLSGAFGAQNGEFTMPAANVNVNVWFKKGWPDEVKYRLALEVFGPAYQADAADNNYASFAQVVHTDAGGATVLTAPDSDPVYSGQRKLLTEAEGVAFDRDTVYVNIHKRAGSYVDASSIRITDSDGNVISWWYAPGGIAFTMPPRSTTVRINFRQITDPLPTYTATLHVSGAGTGDSAKLSTAVTNAAGANPATADGEVISGLLAGDTLSLEALPGADRHITAVYAVEEKTGRIIDLTRLNGGQRTRSAFVHAGDKGDFAMPEDNVHVYVRFAEGKVEQDDLPLTLMVSGPAEANPPAPGHGAATEVTGLTAAEHKTMEVDAPGMDTRFVKAGNTVVTTFEPNKDDGYAITRLEVYDANGKPVPYEWISVLQDPPTADLDDPTVWPGTAPEDIASHPGWKQNPKLQITFDMPAAGVTIHVTYGKPGDTAYRAQIVVNDDAYSDQPTPSRNNAWFDETLKNKLRTAKPGEWVDLDLSVHPGYRIEYIKVVPQSFGIVPGLPLGPFFTQSTGFVMPEGDVTVYVKFADDGVEEFNATLVATGAPTGDILNYATIVSPRSQPVPPATPTRVYVNAGSATATARPDMDWVTADYYWNTNGSAYVVKVTVTTVSGVNVPFTQQVDPAAGHGRITFPMVNENVTVEVKYGTTEVKAEVYLHVIDDTADPEALIGNFANATLYDAGLANVLLGALSPLRRDTANPWGNSAGPEGVAAGETVKLLTNASSDNGVYLRSAYVLYEDVGQMVDLTHISTTQGGATQQKSFVVHPGENHVYVTFTRTEPKPDEHSAILMLRAPEDSAGRASIAAGDVYGGAPTDRDSLDRANHGHAEVIATQGQRVYIQVAPAEGYVIDSVLVTPLGFPLKTHAAYNYTMVGNTISFDMPHRDVAITVVLKRGTNQHYDVNLYYVKETADVNINDSAQLAWTDGTTPLTLTADLLDSPANVWVDVQHTEIREGTKVTLTGHLAAAADPAKPDTILSAFVLRSNGTLVTLSPPLEGEQADAAGDVDHAAVFTMPAADVDVFLVVTTEPPPTPWHTAVLVATDTSPSKVNSGLNKGDLWKDTNTTDRETAVSLGNPGCVWIPMAEGEKFYVQPEAAPGYTFVPPATVSCNDGAHGGNMYTESNSPYLYSDTMDTCNKAALIHFVSDEALDLTVIVRDPENPGDGTATQTLLTRQPTANPPVDDLTLTSTNVGGAYQVMKGVTPGEPVLLTATPAAGFTATAQIRYYDGSTADIPLTAQTNGTLTGSIPMPANNATIIVTFHGDYTGTLTLRDLSTRDETAQATMEEDSRPTPGRVTVNHLGTSDSLTHLPHGTTLTANMVQNESLKGKTVTALLHRNGSTRLMAPTGVNTEGVDVYTHTIDRADAEIIFVVRDDDDPTYVAAVHAVNKPAGTADPFIENTTNTAAVHGDGRTWTAAVKDDAVTVTLDVPEGYEARLAVDNGLTLTVPGPVSGPASGQTTQLTMPEANVQVTVTYVRTEFDLTLRVYAPAGTTNPTKVGLDPTDPDIYLSGAQNGDTDSERMEGGETLTLLEATPDTGAKLLTATYSAADGSFGYLDVNDTFPMPRADTVVTVRYGRTDPPPDDPDPFIALVEVVDNDNAPGNAATTLKNATHSTLPGVSPYWVEGQTGDSIQVTYTVAPGYIARITARKRGEAPTAATLPVATVSSASNGAATVTMPGGTDIVIRIEYLKDDTPKLGDVILQLVKHGTQAGNRADVTSPFAVDPTLDLLATNGAAPDNPASTVTTSHYVDAADATSPVETEKVESSVMGNELFVYANWAANYQVVRMTIAVRDKDGNETPEVPIAISRYGSAAAGRTLMPYVDRDNGEAAVVRVYYGNIFWARLHIVPHDAGGLDVDGNATSATDDRATTVTSVPGATVIRRDTDRLVDFMGNDGETVQTNAKPDPAAPNEQRLVGVVWESASTGAASAAPHLPDPADTRYSTDHRYDFEMPADNVDFYAVYEKESDNHSYIAKVKLDGTAHLGSGQNAVSITNKSDTAAAHGAYWTAAKKGENIVVNVKVAPGYKAEVIATYKDNAPAADHTPPYDFYISRTKFVPNLTLGKDGAFSMPADTDATVTVRFTKGYDLSLAVVDSSKLADDAATPARVNKATVTTGETPSRKLEGTSAKQDGSAVTYDPATPVLTAVNGGVSISTAVAPATDGTDTALYKVLRASPFTGTVRVDLPTPGTPPVAATSPYSYAMPSADVAETVVFYNEKTPLLAKVEVKGESDINGNAATPIKDRTDTTSPDGGTTPAANETVRGTVWTTTTHATNKTDAHTIDLTLTVAKGYVAKIRVRRDNDNYYNNPTDETKWDWLDMDDYKFTEVVTTADGTTEELLPGDKAKGEVQMGYKADLIDAASPFPNEVSGDQHFRFTMAYDVDSDDDGTVDIWATDVTVIVEFEFAGTIPQPFDPRNVKDDDYDRKPEFLEQGFIYGENRGGFATVEIPTLIQKIADGEELFHSNNHTPLKDTADKKNDVKFSFFLYDADTDVYTPLVLGTDVLLEPYDTEDADTYTKDDPYNYYKGDDALWKGPNHWHPSGTEAEQKFTGSKFKLIPTGPRDVVEDGVTVSKRTDGAQALYDMLNNKGSLETYKDENGATKYRTTLYVIAEDTIGQMSAYTQVWIRPHFTLDVSVISYAPNHTTTLSLYQPTPTPAPAVEEPWLQDFTDYDGEALSANKYHQKVSVKSSELLGGFTSAYDPGADTLLSNVDKTAADKGEFTYKLTVEKVSCLTYTREKLDLSPYLTDFDLTTKKFPDYYNDATLTYSIQDVVYLITGDVNGDGYTKWQDYDTVYTYVWRGFPWNNTQTAPPSVPATDPGYQAQLSAWNQSTYNPASRAYRCDLNGDRVLSVQDLNLVQTAFDYNRSAEDYKWTLLSDGTTKVLPFGFGSAKKDYAALFALAWDGEDVFPVESDPYWDAPVDPESTEALPLDTLWVDENGVLWADRADWQEAPVLPGGGRKPDRREEEIMEVPKGEEAMDGPVYRPDAFFDLPSGPMDRLLPDDNAAGAALPETDADTTKEE